jgi:hypothetical protein
MISAGAMRRRSSCSYFFVLFVLYCLRILRVDSLRVLRVKCSPPEKCDGSLRFPLRSLRLIYPAGATRRLLCVFAPLREPITSHTHTHTSSITSNILVQSQKKIEKTFAKPKSCTYICNQLVS